MEITNNVELSKGIKKIQDLLNELDKNSERYLVLETALHFKTNWIELGERLYNIFKSESFKKWGYNSFDRYCSQEIGIRKKTAEKLTTSYYFLKENEPKVLNDYSKKEIPDFNTIDFLAKIQQDKSIPEEKFEELRNAAFEEGCSDKSLKKKYNDFLEETKESIEDDNSEESNELSEKDLTSLIHAFERIDRKVEDIAGLPVDIKTDIRKLLARLKTLA